MDKITFNIEDANSPAFLIDKIMQQCNLTSQDYLDYYNEDDYDEEVLQTLNKYNQNNEMVIKVTIGLVMDLDYNKIISTVNKFIVDMVITSSIGRESSTNSITLHELLKRNGSDIELCNYVEGKEDKIESIPAENEMNKIKQVFSFLNFEAKKHTTKPEDLSRNYGNIGQDMYFKLFTNVGKKEYVHLMHGLALEINDSKNLSPHLIHNFFMLGNTILNEKMVHGALLVTNRMIEMAEYPSFLYKYQKTIIEQYLKLTSALFIDKDITNQIMEMYYRLPNVETKFSKELINNELGKYNLSLSDMNMYNHGQSTYEGTQELRNYIRNDFKGSVELKGTDNINNIAFFKGIASIELFRKYYDNNNIIDNDNIEYMIKLLEYDIEYIMHNHNKFNHFFYHRVISLIYFKNSIKYRYNMDNNKWDNLDIINAYYKEIMFILDNGYHYIAGANYKCMEILIQIQSLYNKLPIHEYISIEDTARKYIGEFKNIVSIDELDFPKSMFGIVDSNFDNIDNNYELNKGRTYLEQTSIIAGQVMFDMMNHPLDFDYTNKKLIDITYSYMFKGMLELPNETSVLKNTFDLDYIYPTKKHI